MDQRGNLMKQSSFYQFYDRAEDIRHKFISALPVIPVKKTAGRISRYTFRSFTAPAACLRRFSSIAA